MARIVEAELRDGQVVECADPKTTLRDCVEVETGIVESLRIDELDGAALDISEDEPPWKSEKRASAPNLMLTPHMAGLTEISNTRVGMMVAPAVSREPAHG
jgi:(S)-sulfolactate dehydrogenase